jgi:hypothetical protein
MSRYEFLPRGWSSPYTFAIGWDVPLDTYFAQVMDLSIDPDDDCVIAWVGGMPPYYHDLDAMLREVNTRISGELPAIALPEETRAKLMKDRQGSLTTHPGRRRPVFALGPFPADE